MSEESEPVFKRGDRVRKAKRAQALANFIGQLKGFSSHMLLNGKAASREYETGEI